MTESTSVYVHIHRPLDVELLNVPANGGHCVKLFCDDTYIFLNGYGEEAAAEARRVGQLLIEAADKVDASMSVIEPEGTTP